MSTDYTLKARKNMKEIVDLYNEEKILGNDYTINEIFLRDEEKR